VTARQGYKRHKVYGQDYPAILRTDNEDDETHGVLVRGLMAKEIKKLDIFEGDVSTSHGLPISNYPCLSASFISPPVDVFQLSNTYEQTLKLI
jgi:hypothetical protein